MNKTEKVKRASSIKRIIEGKQLIDDELKYSCLLYSLALIHFILFVIFYITSVLPLCFYNFFITIFYFYLAFKITKKKEFTRILVLTIIEVLCYSFLATFLLGWSYGFMLYALGMIPVVFYLSATLTKANQTGKATFSFVCTIFIMATFILAKVVCQGRTTLYGNSFSENGIVALYCFNAFISFFVQIFFSYLYTLEIFHFQKRMKLENTHLDNIASLDPLTQLLNRRSMENHLNSSMDTAKQKGDIFSIIIGDIDNFKRVNDTYGHDFGDKVLVNVANIMKSQMRDNDYVCRWGGEEFLLIINAKKDVAEMVGNRIRTEVEKSVVTDGNISVSVTMTFGVADYIPGFSTEKLIQIADDNLYKGKHNGKNQVVA